jgi:hypothetical protein
MFPDAGEIGPSPDGTVLAPESFTLRRMDGGVEDGRLWLRCECGGTDGARDKREEPSMTRRWPCIVLTMLCCLTFATSVFAESLWVLWSQEVATESGLVTEDKKAWRRIAAFDSKSACFSDASTKAEDLAGILRSSYPGDKERKIEVQRLGLGADHLAVKTSFSGGLFDGARMWTFYRCLPDTVEPRGPKRK